MAHLGKKYGLWGTTEAEDAMCQELLCEVRKEVRAFCEVRKEVRASCEVNRMPGLRALASP